MEALLSFLPEEIASKILYENKATQTPAAKDFSRHLKRFEEIPEHLFQEWGYDEKPKIEDFMSRQNMREILVGNSDSYDKWLKKKDSDRSEMKLLDGSILIKTFTMEKSFKNYLAWQYAGGWCHPNYPGITKEIIHPMKPNIDNRMSELAGLF